MPRAPIGQVLWLNDVSQFGVSGFPEVIFGDLIGSGGLPMSDEKEQSHAH